MNLTGFKFFFKKKLYLTQILNKKFKKKKQKTKPKKSLDTHKPMKGMAHVRGP
jgi:hypothetical protein